MFCSGGVSQTQEIRKWLVFVIGSKPYRWDMWSKGEYKSTTKYETSKNILNFFLENYCSRGTIAANR